MKRPLPGSLKTVRVLLFVTAGLTAISVVGALFVYEINAVMLGRLTWAALPGVLSLIFALRLPKGRRVLYWSILVLQVLTMLIALGNLGNGSPQGFSQLLLPILTLVFLTQRASRTHFRAPAVPHA
ncbi:hypothetical protein [Marinactinospora rubrisoli]|uniref:Uncharacterized protein n=1 Tax=Marinactinospora rubrisoli TaxID=2715399 RepID=A0ABW2KFT6_9ACTN